MRLFYIDSSGHLSYSCPVSLALLIIEFALEKRRWVKGLYASEGVRAWGALSPPEPTARLGPACWNTQQTEL